MLTTLCEFISRVEELSMIGDAYYVFEEECSDALRNRIYAYADLDQAAPFQSAMHNLGFDAY